MDKHLRPNGSLWVELDYLPNILSHGQVHLIILDKHQDSKPPSIPIMLFEQKTSAMILKANVLDAFHVVLHCFEIFIFNAVIVF